MTGIQPDTSLEQLVEERHFAGIVRTYGEVFFRLSNTLLGIDPEHWNKKHYFQLLNEAESLESFLDDYGARFNRTYAFLTELVASIRGFAQAGYSISHLESRLPSYGAPEWLAPDELGALVASVGVARNLVRDASTRLLQTVRHEARELGVPLTKDAFPESNFLPAVARRRLPRNLGVAELVDEKQKIAEVASKYLQACEMLRSIGVRRIEDPIERREFLARAGTEELARVYEATVHNLQSTYDTHIQNTVLEGRDERLRRLRGHISGGLHLLTALTHLVHFVERHEDEIRSEEVKRRIGRIIDRDLVQDVIVNHLLLWADRILADGRATAEELLPAYTNVQELELELRDGLVLHARPAALVVGIVNHYGTPVELEIAGQRCNAASILELLVHVGTHADEKRYVFRGDELPLRDIRILFENGLGEDGLEKLPAQLGYLKRSQPS